MLGGLIYSQVLSCEIGSFAETGDSATISGEESSALSASDQDVYGASFKLPFAL